MAPEQLSPCFPLELRCMSRSSAFAHVTRLVAGATVSLGLALSPWNPSVNLQAQQQSRKQALLGQPNRAADAPEVLRVIRGKSAPRKPKKMI